jgi:hypothetical protein
VEHGCVQVGDAPEQDRSLTLVHLWPRQRRKRTDHPRSV